VTGFNNRSIKSWLPVSYLPPLFTFLVIYACQQLKVVLDTPFPVPVVVCRSVLLVAVPLSLLFPIDTLLSVSMSTVLACPPIYHTVSLVVARSFVNLKK